MTKDDFNRWFGDPERQKPIAPPDLVAAAHLIRDFCNSFTQGECHKCIFNDPFYGCHLSEGILPRDWNISDAEHGAVKWIDKQLIQIRRRITMFKKFDPPADVKFDKDRESAYNALSDFIIDFFKSNSNYDSVIIGIWTDTLHDDVVFGDLDDEKIDFLTDWYEGGNVKVRYIIGLLTIDSLISNNMI